MFDDDTRRSFLNVYLRLSNLSYGLDLWADIIKTNNKQLSMRGTMFVANYHEKLANELREVADIVRDLVDNNTEG